MGYPRTTPKVLAALQTFPIGQDVSAQNLVHATGLDGKQVCTAMRTLIEQGEHNIKVVLRGATWRYMGPVNIPTQRVEEAPKEDRLFEYVGKLSNGAIMVRGDQTEVLYLLTELEA